MIFVINLEKCFIRNYKVLDSFFQKQAQFFFVIKVLFLFLLNIILIKILNKVEINLFYKSFQTLSEKINKKFLLSYIVLTFLSFLKIKKRVIRIFFNYYFAVRV